MIHTAETGYDATCLFHIPQRKTLDPETGLDVTLHKYGRQELIQAVRDEGVDMHITRGRHMYDDPSSIPEVLIPDFGTDSIPRVVKLTNQALSEYGVVRTISGRLEHANVPVLTNSAVKKLASDKFASAAMLEKLGMHEGAALVAPAADLASLIDGTPGHDFVLKPRHGMRSEGVIVGSKHEVIADFEARDNKEIDYILEEKLDFTTPFPEAIRGYDADNQARLELANREGANKELRTLYFGEGNYCYIARAAKKDEKDFLTDDWVYIDPASIPEEIIEMDKQIVSALEVETGLREFHVAIDKTFATTDTAKHPKWRTMEINAGEPQLVRSHQHAVIAREQTKFLAEQIARIARKRSLQ